MKDWQIVFSALGQNLTEQAVGCCGMAGTYGHETRNRQTSETIYNLSWQVVVANAIPDTLIATGYSCRSQIRRLQGTELKHPLQYLLERCL